MTTAVPRLQHLDRAACFRLLADRPVGRLAVVQGHQPLIFPVNYTIVDEQILFRTDTGTKLTAALRNPVCFEVDEFDPIYHEGWSVVVTGSATEITDFDSPGVGALRRLPLLPWSAGSKDHWIRIDPVHVEGRRLTQGAMRS